MFTSSSCPSPLFTLCFYDHAEWVLCLNYHFLCQQWGGGAGWGGACFLSPVKSQEIILRGMHARLPLICAAPQSAPSIGELDTNKVDTLSFKYTLQ